MRKLFTSESVTEGHPDKICDQISDAILDAYLREDPESRVAIETLATKNYLLIAGEVRSQAQPQIKAIARQVLQDIGYTSQILGIDAKTCDIDVRVHQQSPDIAQGVDESDDHEQGAGDQGLMFGFACSETDDFMPLPISLAHKLTKQLAATRRSTGAILGPDGKAQVTVEYADNNPQRVHTVLVSSQHSDSASTGEVKELILEKVIKPVLGDWFSEDTRVLINPTGRFVIGGPEGDAGLTGRKIIVDTYGGMGRHGGGAFSGKDSSKVDRSGAYAARWVAKNLVAAGLCRRCEIQVSYAIGVARPLSIYVDSFGTGTMPDSKIADLVAEVVDLRPKAISTKLNLQRPIYSKTAKYGHFGRDDVPWEQLDLVGKFKN